MLVSEFCEWITRSVIIINQINISQFVLERNYFLK